MPLPDPNIFGPATLSVTQGIGAFNSFLPRLSEVRKANPHDNPDVAADVRMGEVAGVALTMGIGVIASSLTGSPVPAFTAAITCLVIIFLYESVLRADNPMVPASAKPTLPSNVRTQ